MSALDDINRVVTEVVLRLPLIVGNAGVNWVKDSFRIQGFRTVSNFGTAWNPRKDKSRKNAGRDVLIKTGRLRRSYRVLSYTATSVTIGSDLVYAAVHNEGLTINHPGGSRVLHFKSTSQNLKTGKLKGKFSKERKADYAQKVNIGAYEIPMPKRQAMPIEGNDSPIFIRDMELIIQNELNKIS